MSKSLWEVFSEDPLRPGKEKYWEKRAEELFYDLGDNVGRSLGSVLALQRARALQLGREMEKETSDAYLRLRRLIPGALSTPPAPSAERVWEHTEACLRRMVSPDEAAMRSTQGVGARTEGPPSLADEARIRADERERLAKIFDEHHRKRTYCVDVQTAWYYAADICRYSETPPKTREAVLEEALRDIRDGYNGNGKSGRECEDIARDALEWRPS